MDQYHKDRNDIQNFIEKILYRKLMADQLALKILSEGDLQSCVYHHLRKLFDKKKIVRWYIVNKLPMGEKTEDKTFPDIAIVYMREKGKVYPVFLIELKEDRIFKKERVNRDIRKLNTLRKKIDVEQTYFIYAITDETHTRKEFNKMITDSDPKFKDGYNFPITVNVYGEKIRPIKLANFKDKLNRLRKYRNN